MEGLTQDRPRPGLPGHHSRGGEGTVPPSSPLDDPFRAIPPMVPGVTRVSQIDKNRVLGDVLSTSAKENVRGRGQTGGFPVHLVLFGAGRLLPCSKVPVLHGPDSPVP